MFEGTDPLWAEKDYDGEFAWDDKRRFVGLLRGFCPLRGVLTDGNGRRWRVAYSGEALVTEELLPVTSEEVTPPARPHTRPPHVRTRQLGLTRGPQL